MKERFTMKNALKILLTSVILAALALGGLYLYNEKQSENTATVTKISLKNIGELATQEADVTAVKHTNNFRKLSGINIPFTHSVYIYSYDFIIKAGYDFTQASYEVDEANKTVTFTLPEVEILSKEPVLDSFKIYVESESKFNDITLDENNEALKNMQKQAVEQAEENGIYEKAEENAKTLLTNFLSSQYDSDEYDYQFHFKGD